MGGGKLEYDFLTQTSEMTHSNRNSVGNNDSSLPTPLDCKEIKPVHPKGDQRCMFIGKTDAEAESPVLWPPDVKS